MCESRLALQKTGWEVFRTECEGALAEAPPPRAIAQSFVSNLTEVVLAASQKHVPGRARVDTKPWALELDLQRAVEEQCETHRKLRETRPCIKGSLSDRETMSGGS